MKVSVIRKIDKFLGVPLCLILTVIDKIVLLFESSKRSVASPQNILFIELSEMGSAIIAYSALQKAKELFPGANLFFLIFEENKESVHLTQIISRENVLTISSKTFLKFAFDTLSVLWKVRHLKMDTTIDLELFSRATAIISYLTGAKRRVGFYKFRMEGLYRGELITHKVSYNMYQHMAINFLNLVYALNAPLAEAPKLKKYVSDKAIVPLLESTEEEKTAIFEKLKSLQPCLKKTDRLIVFNPHAGLLPVRAWPLDKYVELATELVADETIYIVVMGSEDASKETKIIKKAIGERCIDLTNMTTLRQIIDLFNICDLLVTNDSGPAHFASCTSIKNFVFFGPETPRLYAPLGKYSFPIFSNYSCSPCLSAFNHRNTSCKDPQCLKSITVKEVYDKVIKAIGK